MVRLREKLNPEEVRGALGRPTEYMTMSNIYGLHCRECGALYYVGESIYRRVSAAIDTDPSDNPFICDDCEEEYAKGGCTH